MLMYRQIDPQRNMSAIKREAFPEHIQVSHTHTHLNRFRTNVNILVLITTFLFDNLATTNQIER